MRIDWIVALVIFLLLASWTFSYYSLFNAGKITSRSASAFLAGEKIIDYLQVRLSSVPANFSIGGNMQNVTLWAYMNSTANEKNSTRVVLEQLSNESLPCMIAGERVYWKSNLTSGPNFFFIEYADLNTTLGCNDTLAQSDENQTTLWVVERKRIFSASKNNEICSLMNSIYEGTKSDIGTTFEFSVLLETPSSSLTCGSTIPRTGREVFVLPARGVMMEGGDVNISVRLWQ